MRSLAQLQTFLDLYSPCLKPTLNDQDSTTILAALIFFSTTSPVIDHEVINQHKAAYVRVLAKVQSESMAKLCLDFVDALPSVVQVVPNFCVDH